MNQMNSESQINTFLETKRDGSARTGRYKTRSGEFSTPNFMPVGTRGSVKGVDVERLSEIGAQILLVNTYHLWLRPTAEIVSDLGGIHRFMNWPGPILSDSGGYQVFSLQGIRKLKEEGVEFRSHIDGAKCFLSPEVAISVQEKLGVDIAMVLDECPMAGLSQEELDKSLSLTLRWAKRSLDARKNPQTAIFGITQGGSNSELRKRAAEELSAMPFDGMAIGGLSVGEKKEIMYEVLSYHVSQLPSQKIKYLMGVGTPEDIIEAVSKGVDLFDCVMPTRAGRFGRAFVNEDQPTLNIRNSCHLKDTQPLDKTCSCLACRNYCRGYIHHLFRVGEMLGPQLLSVHNLAHYLDLMKKIRQAIETGQFSSLYAEIKKRWHDAPVEEAEVENSE